MGGEKGWCLAGSELEVYRFAPHHGEEPPISGTCGSGTVFFSRCTLRCLYCQNFLWSQEGRGQKMSVEELAEALKDLVRRGCHNWNFVSPTPWLPWIQKAVMSVSNEGVRLPAVCNTSGFERIETLEACADLFDVYLTDLRYSRPDSAAEGSGAASYVATARRALKEMWRQKGPLKRDENGVAISGVICRLLVLPGKAQEAVENLEWIAENIGQELSVSIMSQYVPAHRAVTEPWNKRVSMEEYEAVTSAAERLGLTAGWIQDMNASTPTGLAGFEMPAGRG